MRNLARYLTHTLSEWNVRILVIATALGMAMCCSGALAQSGVGSVQGTVTDSAGAAIPGASVHLVNPETGRANDTNTNSVGFYQIPSLFTGNYTLTFSAPGMKSFQSSISLQVAQIATINPALSVGAATEKVVVAGNEIQLATYDSPTISAVLDNQRISQLPMNGRSLSALTGETTPGDESGRVGGLEVQGMAAILDGAPSDNLAQGGAAALVDPDAVREARLETSNASAQYSTPASTIITTKSGTNDLHGSGFETMRNNYIGIAKSRSDPSNLVAPHLIRNEFGASVGGPVRIPKIYNGTDKTFFFFAYERYSLRQSVSALGFVPTLKMQNGDFSELQASGVSTPIQLYDANTSNNCTVVGGNTKCRAPFAANQIPLSRISPFAKTLYPLIPQPTNASNPAVTDNLTGFVPTIQTTPQVTFRLDHSFGETDHAYLRYTQITAASTTLTTTSPLQAESLAGSNFPAGVFGQRLEPSNNFTAALGYSHIFSSSFVSETILDGQWETSGIYGGGNLNSDFQSQLGLPDNFGATSMQLSGTYQTYVANRRSYENSQIVQGIDENLTKNIGHHQMAFGFRYKFQRQGIFPDANVNTTAFNGYATALVLPSSGLNYTTTSGTGNANADFFLGAASSYGVNDNEKHLTYSGGEYDSYFQDDFHATSRLTVNLGLRWEVHPSLKERNLNTISFDLKNHALVIANLASQIARGGTTQPLITNLQALGLTIETPQTAGLPDKMVFDSDLNFAPRLGAAYVLWNGKYAPVLRGGYGMYIFPVPYRNYYSAQASNAPFEFGYSMNSNAANQSPDALPNYLLRYPQQVIAGQNSSGVVNTSSANAILPGAVSDTFLDPHFSPNRNTQANATIEQPLKGDSILRLTYSYNHGTNLDQFYELNTHPSTYVYETTTGNTLPTGTYASSATGLYDQTIYGGTLNEDTDRGYSTDNALQVNFQHLFKNGYAYQAYYVYSRAFRIGGNSSRDSILYPIGDFAPGAAPVSSQGLLPWQASDALDRAEDYTIDTGIPEHRINFNGIVDLPMGRNKRFFSNVNRFVDELIGGYQVAGAGTVVSQYFAPAATNWGGDNPTGGGTISPVHIYKHSQPINDCRSGVCYKEFQWFNGFISPLITNNPCGTTTITGLSSDAPYETPIGITTGTVTCKNGAASAANTNFLTNNVPVTYTAGPSNGTTAQVAYSPGPGINPYSHTVLPGPINYSADLSVFKVFPITERVNLRINMDAFNAFNIQGYVNPNTTDGTESLRTSYWTPRQVQFTARLTF